MCQPRWLVAITVLCLGLTVAAALHLDDMRVKRGLAHDEAVSYLAAAGHEDDYVQASTSILAGRWVTAAAWKRMLQPDGFWGFGRVTAGLVHTDNHPPLYFWALHLWVWLVGLHLWSGPLLNLAFALLTAIALFVLGRRVIGDTLFAAMGAAIWACSFPVVVTSRMARQYDLLALLTVLFVLVALRILDSDKEMALGDSIALALLTAACLLTHYEFTAFAAGSVVLFICILWRHRKRLLVTLAAMATGTLLAVLLNPRFYESFLRQRAQASQATLALFCQRVDAVRLALQSFFHWAVPGPVAAFVVKGRVHAGLLVCVIVLLALLGVGATAVMPATRDRLGRLLARISRGTWGFLAFVGLATATTVLPYLVFQVPSYAMGGRYLALFWPLLALLAVLLFRSLGRSGVVIVAILGVWVVVPAAYLAAAQTPASPQLERFPASARVLVVNTLERGQLLPVLWQVPDAVAVYADASSSLLESQHAWLPRLSAGAYFASASAPIRSDPTSQAPLALLTSHREIAKRTAMWWATGSLYEVVGPHRVSGT
jgi:hypothetical protein